MMIKNKKIMPLFLLLPVAILINIFSLQGQLKEDAVIGNHFDTINASEVQQRFTKGGTKNIHPRLFFSKDDISRVKLLLKNGDSIITIAYEHLRQDADKLLNEPLLSYELDAAKLRIGSIHKFATQVTCLVMMYQLTGKDAYAARCYAQLEKFATYPDWGADRHFLDTGIGAFDFALAYDGLFDWLKDDQKIVLRNEVMRNVLLPAKKQMEENKWWHNFQNNWNGICNGGIIMAALAMYEEDESLMSNVIALAANGLPNYINTFEPDGQSEEGLMYWGYGLMYTSVAMQSMHNTLGTAFDLDNKPGFKKTGWFPLHVSGPVTSLSVGDDPVKKSKMQSFFWFAKRFNDTALAKFQYDLCLENKNVSWADMIYYDPAMIQSPVSELHIATENYIHGIELMSLRDNWSKDAFFVSMHGGKNNASHGHLDAGSFDIQAMGEVWAYGDLGSDNYNFPGYFCKINKPGYFDLPTVPQEPCRWHFYRLRAEGKNCLVFNPAPNPDQNELGVATLLKQNIGVNESSYIVSLTDCYKRDVKNYTRKIQLNKSAKLITVQDDFVTVRKSDVWWSMHTKAGITILPGGKTAVLKIGTKKMLATIKSPANAVFQVLAATYLPGESFPLTTNSDNKAYKKLAIKLIQQTGVTICVDFSPASKSGIGDIVATKK